MDPDIDIYKRQMQMETEEKYQLYARIKELNEEIDKLKYRLQMLEDPPTLSGDERTW